MSIVDQVVDVSHTENVVEREKKVPKVSIGMPVYNGEPFIREALDSLLAQTFTDFELIISDNASTDGTEAICREYAAKDARIRYVRQVENRGGTANFQFVLDESVGVYFMWAAADDIRAPDCLETYLEHIGKAGGVFTTYGVFDRKTNTYTKRDVPVMSENYTTDKLLRIYFKNTITSMIYGLFKKEELIKNLPFSDFDWADSFLIIKIISNSKYNMIKTTDPKYYAGMYGSYRAKPFSGNYIKPHKYILTALPYAFKAGGLSIVYHAKTLIQSYRINFRILRELNKHKNNT